MPILSPRKKLDVPEIDTWTFIYENPDRWYPEDHVLLIDAETKRTLTFADLKTGGLAFGRGLLHKWAWQKGETLMIVSANNIESSTIIGGILYAGGVVASGNPIASGGLTLNVERLGEAMQLCKARAIVVGVESIDLALAAAKVAGISKEFFCVLADESVNGIPSWRDIKAPAEAKVVRPVIDAKTDNAFTIFTSGTTGTPKVGLRTHQGANWEAMWGVSDYGDSARETCPKQICINTFPLYMSSMYIVRWFCLYGGMQLVIPKDVTFTRILELAQEHKATELYLTPPLIRALAYGDQISHYDISSVSRAHVWGDVLQIEATYALWNRHKIALRLIYGMTEVSVISNTKFIEPGEHGFGSCGALTDVTSVKILGEDGEEVPEGIIGRVMVNHGFMARRYLNNPILEKMVAENDGYMDTDDFGMVYEGQLFLHGRIGNAVQYGKKIIRPVEIERIIERHTKVQECILKAVPGEVGPKSDPRAYVVLKPGVEKTEQLRQEIFFVVLSQMEMPCWLRGGVKFVDEIPKSPAGKILRNLLD